MVSVTPEAPAGSQVALTRLGPAVTYRATLPGRAGSHTEWPTWCDPVVVQRLRDAGVERPWTHQAAAAGLAWSGHDVVLATGTASGKTLAYHLPALTWARAEAPRQRAGTLYLAPTKALAADQAARLEALAVPGVRAGVVDGDSSRDERDWARAHASLVLTNPDMLHRSVLPSHRRWREFLGGLRLVVVDECHLYRGLFGSHVAWVLRRLLRLAEAYGAQPVVMAMSATTADPQVATALLVGRGVVPVTQDGSAAGPRELVLADATASREHAGVGAWSARLLADLTSGGQRVLAFSRSRRGTEAVAAQAQRLLHDAGSSLRVAAYRGGYLPEERRVLERDLRSGRLAGVAATNALELGIDIVGMDAVLVGGWPGTRAAFWQQAGRAGRDTRAATAVFLAGDDPLEQYVVHHPEVLVDAPLERTVLDPFNPHVMGPQLCAAAGELPWRPAEVDACGAAVRAELDQLAAAGVLRARPDGWFWPRRESAAAETDIRGGGGPAVCLVEVDTGRLLGTVDAARAPATAHDGAVYVHQGVPFVVVRLDLDDGVALLLPAVGDYETVARSVAHVQMVAEQQRRAWGDADLVLGTVDVTSRVVSYQRRCVESGAVLAEVPLDLPEQRLRTIGCWWTVPDDVVAGAGLDPVQLPGAAHAAEHASIGLLPLFATCDRWDVGGVSTALHPDTGRLTVVVHDAQPGGAGFAARGFDAAGPWLSATRDHVASCACTDGCPSCVQSPKCGNGNSPLDKQGAVALLTALLAQQGRHARGR
jgi:DEAD/DEAH box helicase domain-containing protein